MRLGPAPAEPEVPGQFWIDFIRDTAPVFRKPTIEQLESFIAPTFQALIDGAKYVHPRLLEIFDELAPGRHRRGQRRGLPGAGRIGPAVGPDRVVQSGRDQGSGRRAVLVGLPGRGSDRLAGASSRRCAGRMASMWADFDAFCREHGDDGLVVRRARARLHLRIAVAEPLQLPGRGRLPARPPARPDLASPRLDRPGRRTRRWELPEHLRSRDGALIYLSLGSLGSADVGLMQRLVDLLATTEHRVIVSKGPLADQIVLHDNQAGEGFLPQPAILPQVDLVITHGGNNTVTEAFHHGKPMIVLPLFWDQVDNAQRVEETGFGRRLATYDFRDEELTDAIDELLADGPLAARLAVMSARIRSSSGTVRAADLIERVALTGQPVTD